MSRVNNSYYAILGILSIGPMSGYKMKAWVDDGIGYFWDIDYKQIYPTLKKIVDEGLATFEVVKSGKRPESKVYKLTDMGMQELKNWLVRPIQEGKQSKNELLLKLFYGHHVPVDINIEHLESYKASRLNLIQEMNRLIGSLESKPYKDDFWYYRMTTINKGLITNQSEIEWCNNSIEYLRKNINQVN